MTPNEVYTDTLTVTRDEATELCIHHLRLAAIFFQSGADDIESFLDEIDRQMAKRAYEGSPDVAAARTYIADIHQRYERMKEDDQG